MHAGYLTHVSCACLQAEAALAGLNNQVLDSEAGRPLSVMRARPRTMTPGPAVMHGGYASPRTHYGVCATAICLHAAGLTLLADMLAGRACLATAAPTQC